MSLKTFCGGTLKALVRRSTLVHVSMHGRITTYPTTTQQHAVNIKHTVH